MQSYLHPFTRPALMLVVMTCLAASVLCQSSVAQDSMTWSFYEGSDPETGRKTARIVRGVPETDNQQLSGICEARSGTSIEFSAITLGANIGDLGDGAAVKVRFSGGGQEHELAGEITRSDGTEEGITGVILRPSHDDQLWDMLKEKAGVDYMIPGYRSTTLDLTGAREPISEFLGACRTYEEALAVSAEATTNEQGTQSGISEKEAFDQAKELGAVEGWEAFLRRFPTGFRADLARAYVQTLKEKESAQSSSAAAPSAPTPAPDVPKLETVEVGPGSLSWRTGTKTIRIASPQQDLQVYTASVVTEGVELIGFCRDLSRDGQGFIFGTIIREASGGGYPRFEERARQGLASAPFWSDRQFKRIDVEFSNGERLQPGTAAANLEEGQLAFGAGGRAFGATSRDLENMMAANAMTVSLPPFVATFQLRGSRNAICDVMNDCGAEIAACGTAPAATRPVVNKSTPSSTRLKCGTNYKFQNGECVLVQNCGRNAYRSPEGDCYCNNGFRRTNSGRCVRTARRPQIDNCPGDSVLVNGRCVKEVVEPPRPPVQCRNGQVYSQSANRCTCQRGQHWNGQRCVITNAGQPTQQQNNAKTQICQVLLAACQLGSQGACNKYNSGGCG